MKFILSCLLTFLIVCPLEAYVGPGAGFAFAGSFFFIFIAFFLAVFNFLTFPIRAFFKYLKRRHVMKNASFKRVVVVGFDGVDYRLLSRYINKSPDSFPNFSYLKKEGTFKPLFSTEPPISPVAWSTFSTGVNPGKHNIFDFLSTDRQTYMPKLSCSEITPPRKSLSFGKFSFPIGAAKVELMRKSKSFWKIVSSKGIYSSVLRVPFTFPPEKFYGEMLSGLGTPDLRGTQGSFTFYSYEKSDKDHISDGVWEKLEKTEKENVFKGKIKGPLNPFLKNHPPLELSFLLIKEKDGVLLDIEGKKVKLKKNQLTPWIDLDFKLGFIKISGIAQFALQADDPLKLYLSPININPAKPSMAVSSPKIFSVYLSRLLGPYATLGMAEDTWALNEKVVSEETFLDQVKKTQKEREIIFFNTFKKIKKGLVVQVFESTDRVQHMFWRYIDKKTAAEKDNESEEVKNAIFNMYRDIDVFLGKLLKQISKKDLLLIVSDHGFGSFHREFHLNSWLYKEGYITLKEGCTKSDKWYADVDWSKSKAYGQGLNGLYINLQGREKQGIVKNKELENLKDEIKEKLLKVKDPVTGRKIFCKVYKRQEIYKGPYLRNAPDILLAYNHGCRVSWESSVNYVGNEIFTDNVRNWSGDHAFSKEQIPGIFFSNHKVNKSKLDIIDIAPTVLKAFGIKKEAFIEGFDMEVS